MSLSREWEGRDEAAPVHDVTRSPGEGPMTAIKTKTTSDLSVHLTEHPNAAIAREAFAAFARGDLDTVRAGMTADCTWVNAGTSPIAGTHQGWDAISAMFGRLIEVTDGTFSMNVLSTLADDRFVVTIYDATSTINSRTDTQRFVLTDEMTADGKVSATQVLAYDQAAADAHWAG